MRDQHGNEFFYNEPEFVVSSSTIGKKLSPEHEAILSRARRQQLEHALALSAERRARWGLPPLRG